MVILDKLKGVKNKWPDKTVFIEDTSFKTKTITFLKFYEDAFKLAKYLRKQGIQKGTNVSIFIPMSIDLYKTLTALWIIGATPVFFDYSANEEYVSKCLNIIKPDFVISKGIILLYAKTKKCFKTMHKIDINKCKETLVKEDYNYEKGLENDGAIITFTSGSTGIPKVVVRTHQFLIDQHSVIEKNLNYKPSQIDLGILPIFTLANIATGITTVIPHSQLKDMSKINAKNITEQILKYKINSMTISPSVLQQILDYADKKNIILDTLQTLHIGGGPVFPNQLKRINEMNLKAFIVYGSSEAEPISILSWKEMLNGKEKIKNGSGLPVGKIIPDISLKIIHNDVAFPDKKSTEYLNETTIGEIVVSGINVLKGYFNGVGDEDNKININDTIWHKTGDCGYLDDNNILWLVGRKNNFVKMEDEIIYPFTLQAILDTEYNTHKSAYFSHNNKCYLVLEEKIEIEKSILERYRINEILYIDKIPMDKRHNSKVDLPELKNILNFK